MQDLVSDIYMCIILMKQAEGVKLRLFNTGHTLLYDRREDRKTREQRSVKFRQEKNRQLKDKQCHCLPFSRQYEMQ